jgi:6-phosphogluconate dehydrogenase
LAGTKSIIFMKVVEVAGPSMMPGGSREGYEAIKHIVEKVAAQVDDGPCVTYIGPGGAGND